MKTKIIFMAIALLVAIVIWFQVNLLREQDTIIEIPVRIVNIPDNLYLYKFDNPKIPFRVSGSGFNILLFHLSGQTVDYNGSDVVLGENQLDIAKVSSSMAHYASLGFYPLPSDHNVTFITERIQQKRVPVVFEFYTENDKKALIDNSFVIDDYFVTLSGPSREIESVDNVFTEKISADIIRARTQSVRITPINEHIIIIPATLDLMKASDIIITRTLSAIPIYHDRATITIFPQRVSVKVEGKQEIINSLSVNDIQAFIFVQDFEDNVNADVQVRVPEHITIIDFTPNQVNVRKVNR